MMTKKCKNECCEGVPGLLSNTDQMFLEFMFSLCMSPRSGCVSWLGKYLQISESAIEFSVLSEWE